MFTFWIFSYYVLKNRRISFLQKHLSKKSIIFLCLAKTYYGSLEIHQDKRPRYNYVCRKISLDKIFNLCICLLCRVIYFDVSNSASYVFRLLWFIFVMLMLLYDLKIFLCFNLYDIFYLVRLILILISTYNIILNKFISKGMTFCSNYSNAEFGIVLTHTLNLKRLN